MSAAAVLTCQNCQHSVDADSKFCQHCAAEVLPLAPAASVEEKQAASITRRYTDAYRVSRVVVGAGNAFKAIGILLGIIIALAFIVLSNGRQFRGDAQVVVAGFGIVLGSIVLAILYIWGVLVSAQGQILKASLDSAVNSSPFLNNQDRAKIMSLPQS